MAKTKKVAERRTVRRKVSKPKRACSFCDASEGDGIEILWVRPVRGPFICEACVWHAVEILQEGEERSSPDVYVMHSKIHGRGVFAGQRIAKGTYVGTYSGIDNGKLTRHNERYAIFSYDHETDEEVGWRVGTNDFRFLNHSDDANLWMDEHFHFYAERAIKKDEELTWYYGDDFSRTRARKPKDK